MKSLYLICSVLIYVKSHNVLKKDQVQHVDGIKPYESLHRDKEKLVKKRDELEEFVFDEGNMLKKGENLFRRSDLVPPSAMALDENYPASMLFRRSDLFRNPMVTPLASFQGIAPNSNDIGLGDEYGGPVDDPSRALYGMGEHDSNNEDERSLVPMMNPYFPYLSGRTNPFERGHNPMYFGNPTENPRTANPGEMLPFRKQLIMGKTLPYILNDNRNGGAQHQLDEMLDNYMYKLAQSKQQDRSSVVDSTPFIDQGYNPMNSPLSFPPVNNEESASSAIEESAPPQGEMQVGPRPIEARFFQNSPEDMDMNMNEEYRQSHIGSPMFPPTAPENAPNFNIFRKSHEENAGARSMKFGNYYSEIEPPMGSMGNINNLFNPIGSNGNRYVNPYQNRKARTWKRKMAKRLSRLASRMNAANVYNSINSDERSYKKGILNSMTGIRKNNVAKQYAQPGYGTRSLANMLNTGNPSQDALESKYQMVINSLSHKNPSQFINIHTYSDIGRPAPPIYDNTLQGTLRSNIPKSQHPQSRSIIPKNSQSGGTKPNKLQPQQRSITPNGITKNSKPQPQQRSTTNSGITKNSKLQPQQRSTNPKNLNKG